MDSFKNFEKSSKNFIKTFGFIKKNTTFVSGFDNQSSAPGRFPELKDENMNNIKSLATTFGYKVEINRHGAYTTYTLRNANGTIRIDKDTVKGHQPWIVRADYKIWVPDFCALMFSAYTSEYTVAIYADFEWHYADIDEADIQTIIFNNRA